MGMAALAMTTTDETQAPRRQLSEAQLERVGIWDLREMARQGSPVYHEAAARVFVRRILDMEAQRRTLYADDHLQGYGASLIAPGYAPGGTDIAREPLATLYDRGIRYHESHKAARRWIEAARLSPRNLLAALIQARKLHGNGDQAGAGKAWVKSYDHIAANLTWYARALKFDAGQPVAGHTFECIEDVPRESSLTPVHERVMVPRDARERQLLALRYEEAQQGLRTTRRRTRHRVAVFKDGKAITNAATQAKTELLFQAKAGVL